MSQKAKESAQVSRARKKLEEKLTQETRMLTAENLSKTVLSMQKWLTRHKSERVPLKNKKIKLFDANKHPKAATSQLVKQLRKRLEKTAASPSLKGRVSPTEK